MRSRIGAASNGYQGSYKKVLCVCSGGLLRSPTAAIVLSRPPLNFNTRACGTADYALVKLDRVLLTWADEIVVMEEEHKAWVLDIMNALGTLGVRPITCLDIPDRYPYRDEELVRLIAARYLEIHPEYEKS